MMEELEALRAVRDGTARMIEAGIAGGAVEWRIGLERTGAHLTQIIEKLGRRVPSLTPAQQAFYECAEILAAHRAQSDTDTAYYLQMQARLLAGLDETYRAVLAEKEKA